MTTKAPLEAAFVQVIGNMYFGKYLYKEIIELPEYLRRKERMGCCQRVLNLPLTNELWGELRGGGREDNKSPGRLQRFSATLKEATGAVHTDEYILASQFRI